jgi:hypothetical protein
MRVMNFPVVQSQSSFSAPECQEEGAAMTILLLITFHFLSQNRLIYASYATRKRFTIIS